MVFLAGPILVLDSVHPVAPHKYSVTGIGEIWSHNNAHDHDAFDEANYRQLPTFTDRE